MGLVYFRPTRTMLNSPKKPRMTPATEEACDKKTRKKVDCTSCNTISQGRMTPSSIKATPMIIIHLGENLLYILEQPAGNAVPFANLEFLGAFHVAQPVNHV